MAFNEVLPVVVGNVNRVESRLEIFDIEPLKNRKEINKVMNELIIRWS